MQKLLIVILMILTVASCTLNSDKKAKNLIRDYLKNHMNDFSSYESVEFGQITGDSTNIEDTEKGKALFGEKKVLEESLKQYFLNNTIINSGKPDKEIQKELYDSALKFESEIVDVDVQLKKLEDKFNPSLKGYFMTHKFRSANTYGKKIIGELTFYFDKDLTKVIYVIDMKDEQRNKLLKE